MFRDEYRTHARATNTLYSFTSFMFFLYFTILPDLGENVTLLLGSSFVVNTLCECVCARVHDVMKFGLFGRVEAIFVSISSCLIQLDDFLSKWMKILAFYIWFVDRMASQNIVAERTAMVHFGCVYSCSMKIISLHGIFIDLIKNRQAIYKRKSCRINLKTSVFPRIASARTANTTLP